MIENKYLFVLSPPYSGSTVLWQLIASSPNVSSLPGEGQFVDGVEAIMRVNPWNTEVEYPWSFIKSKWLEHWNTEKPLLLEKSPPNLIHAKEIERFFEPAYFILLLRNPYANCEGLRRRNGWSITRAAQFWVFCSQQQIQNYSSLQNAIFFTYEKFTQHTKVVIQQIREFLPEIGDLEEEQLFTVHTISGQRTGKIRDFNQHNINCLSSKDIEQINIVLKQHPDVMDYLGYKYLQPGLEQNLKYFRRNLKHKLSRIPFHIKKAITQ